MPERDLVKAWGALVALSLGTVGIASVGASDDRGILAAAAVLALAGIKAHVILTRYLGLSASRFWALTFDLALGIFLTVAFGLYAFGSGR